MTTINKKSLILAALLAFSPLMGFSAQSANTATKLDILWVVDNSGSMDWYQEDLATSVGGFQSSLLNYAKGKLDLKMGLLSTDRNDFPYAGLTSQPYSLVRFQQAIAQLGTSGDASFEQAFFPIKRLLYKTSFLREGSKLAIIVISNELEQGSMSPLAFTSLLYKLRDYHSLSTYGLFSMPEYNCEFEPFTGSRYETMIEATDGKAFPICNPFADSLDQISYHLAQRLSL